jgi:hypothetical protein
MPRQNYTGQAQSFLGDYVQRAGKSFLVINCSDVFGGEQQIKVTPENLAEFYATKPAICRQAAERWPG